MSLIKKTARILCIDGGGIRGLIPATIIAQWEALLGPIANNFHMISGTSTGGILASALAKGVSANDLCNFYKANGGIVQSLYQTYLTIKKQWNCKHEYELHGPDHEMYCKKCWKRK